MITNNFLNEIAKALNNESYTIPGYLAFGSSVIVPNAASTDLSGEFGSRYPLSNSRASNIVTFDGIRVGANVASSSGEYLNSVGSLSSSSGGVLFTENLLSSILHTTAFDVAVVIEVTVSRG